MNPFTDDDLKRLQEKTRKHPNLCVPFDEGRTITFESLLVRLQAAEQAVEAAVICCETLADLDALNWEPEGRPFNWDEVMDKTEDVINEWRKAAGKYESEI